MGDDILNRAQQISHLIYEYFYLRIRLGYYKRGDSLPPIEAICKEFCVSCETVKTALHRLRDEGYIDLRQGRITRVLFDQTEQEFEAFLIEHFSIRWDTFIDLYTSVGLLFAPLLTEAFRRMSEQELDALSNLAHPVGEDALLHFYCTVLQKMDNSLLMNFFWEFFLFSAIPLARIGHPPTQYHAKDNREQMQTLIRKAREQHWESLHDALVQYRITDFNRIIAYMQPRIKPLAKEKQLPFVWRIYRDRPQICYNLATRLLHEIYMGEYHDITYLPSYAEMAEKYGVSVNTVRRAVGMLNAIGAAKSINGKGTQIYSLGKRCNPPNFSDPMIRRNLSFFIQAYELVLYTCEPVMRSFLTELSPEQKETLLFQLEQNLCWERCDVSFWNILLAIAANSRLQVVREFYKTIYGLFLWGYPLKSSIAYSSDFGMEVFTESILRSLREGDIDRCVVTMKELVAKVYPYARKRLLLNGFEAHELGLSNSVRFLAAKTAAPENAI